MFTLPHDFDWATFETGGRQRIRAEFKINKETKIDYRLSYKAGGKDRKLAVGLSNAPMGTMASKLDYLLASLGHLGKLSNNRDYGLAFMNQGGGQFMADIILTARNQNTNERYSSRPYVNKKTGEEVKPIPRGADGLYGDSFVDQHGDSLRVFVDLENFRPVS